MLTSLSRHTSLLCLLGLCFALAQLQPAEATSQSAGTPWSAAIKSFNKHAHFPLPVLSETQVSRLDSGRSVKMRERPQEDTEAPQRAIGMLVIDAPKEAVWIAFRDMDFGSEDQVSEVKISAEGKRPEQWYQFLDLPWPFADRHWVVDTDDTHKLAVETGGKAWEHYWELSSGGPALAQQSADGGKLSGVTGEMAKAAVYTPVCHGAWSMVEDGSGKTLLVYHVTSVVGGNIPDKAALDFAMMSLEKLLRRVERVATEEVSAHYNAAHRPMIGGDGKTIPPGSL